MAEVQEFVPGRLDSSTLVRITSILSRRYADATFASAAQRQRCTHA